MITKNCCKQILKSSGFKVEKVVVLKLMKHLNNLSKELTQKMKESSQLRGRKTIQLKDFEYVMSEKIT
jgi:histone H3/H4